MGVGHRLAIPVFTGHLNLGWHLGNTFQPVLRGTAAVITGAARQNEHRVYCGEHPCCIGTWRVVHLLVKQLRDNALDTFQRIGDGTGLLKDLFLHVVPVGSELGRATVCVHGSHGALQRGDSHLRLVNDPIFAQLNIHQITFFKVHDLVGHAGQCHRITGKKMFPTVLPHTQHQRRTRARAHQTVRFVLTENGDSKGALQLQHSRLHRVKQVAVVKAVHQVCDHLGIGLAGKHIATRLQSRSQFVVVFNNAVMHQGHASGALGALWSRTMAKVGVRITHRRRPVRGPPGMRNAQKTFQAIGSGRRCRAFKLDGQLSHPRSTARPTQPRCRRFVTVHVDGDPTGVVASVLQTCQTLHQYWNHITTRYPRHNAAHTPLPKFLIRSIVGYSNRNFIFNLTSS